MSDKSTSGIKIITINRKASFNFFFKEILEAGIVLKGSEIKSVREKNKYCRVIRSRKRRRNFFN